MSQTKDEKRYGAIERFAKRHGSDYHAWPNPIRLQARNIYLKCDNSMRVKIIDLVGLQIGTSFIYFFDKEK